jgi:hypothetical protein
MRRRFASRASLLTALLVATLPSVSAQQQTPSSPPRTGTAFVAGRVLEDVTGRPIADATVSITNARPSLSGNLMFIQAPNTPVVRTDSQGRYFFGGLPAGSYSPRASKSGYTASTAAAPRAVAVVDGQHIIDLDVRLAKLATLSGTLRDDAGDPVAATDVLAFRRSIANGRPSFQIVRAAGAGDGAARSDDRGAYRITGLVPGDYIVCACSRDPIPLDPSLLTTLAADPLKLLSAAGRALSQGASAAELDSTLRTFPPTFFPSSATVSGASRVPVKSGDDVASIDIALSAVPATRVSGVITGGVSPMMSGQIRLVPLADSDDGNAITQMTPMVVQPDGRFDFANVPPGQYVLRVGHPVTSAREGVPTGDALVFAGAAGAAPPQTGPGAEIDYMAYAAQPVAVGTDGAHDVVVPLRKGVPLSGRVSFDGTASPPAPAAVNSMLVLLQTLAIDYTKAATRDQTVVNPDGTFRFTRGILPGRYFFNSTLVAGWNSVKSISLHGADITDLPIEISDTDPGELSIVFTNTPMATLDGAPAGAAGPARAREDRTALIFPSDTRFWVDPGAGARRFRAVTIANDGTFPPIPLPAGEYVVAIVPDARATDWQDRSQLDALARGAQRVTITDGQHQTVSIPR